MCAPILKVFRAFIVVAVAVLLRVVGRAQSTALSVALGLVVGGALGNLADRVVRPDRGSVIDFVALHFWPTFNVADACIVVGGILAAALIWRGERMA